MKLEQLPDFYEIQMLKARYFRCMDLRLWDDFRDVFTDDYELYVEDGSLPDAAAAPTVRGADTLVAYLSASDPGKRTVHQGHMPEIAFVDADHATGIWAMFDWVEDPERGFGVQGYGHYHEKYLRCLDGKWRIRESHLTRLRLHKATSVEDVFIKLHQSTLDQVTGSAPDR